MNYIVLDMEWNQAESYAAMVKNPVFLTGEIIQIGAVKLNDSFQPVGMFDQRVCPMYYTELHPKVAEVTKLRQEDLRRGDAFPDVFDDFCEWCGEEFAFLIWGTEDLLILRKNMKLHDIDISYMPPCFNLQNMFAAQITQDERQYSLTRALSIVHETPFPAHDALNDAKSTALVCRHLNLQKGLDEYTERVGMRDGCVECYQFEERYFDVADALDDDYVVSFECPQCGDIVWCDHWVRDEGKTLLGLACCEEGQEYLVKLKFTIRADSQVTVKRFVYKLTELLREQYEDCKMKAELWRKYMTPAYIF